MHVVRRNRSIPILAAAVIAVLGVTPANAALPDEGGGGAADLAVAPSRSIETDLDRLTPDGGGNVAVYVELTGTSGVEAARAAGAPGSGASLQAASGTALETQSQADAITAAVSGREIYVTSNLQRGVALQATVDDLAALAGNPQVASIKQIVPKELTNSSTDRITQSLAAWNGGSTGKDVVVAIIDTGIDYTHTNFGGAGTTEAYLAAQALNPTDPGELAGTFPTSKVIGGWDFVGDDYSGGLFSWAEPDANPLDCQGHGSHVAGSAAGQGVNADGTTAALDWDTVTSEQLSGLRIGPGSAPEASLIALRVFGCSGNTGYVGAALDWLADPANPKADVVNLSVGSDFSAVDDPENALIDKLAALGTVVVASAGNGGDVTDVGGSPGNARSTLTVANSVGDSFTFDAAEIVGADGVATGNTTPGQYSANFTFDGDLTGQVAVPGGGEVTGCEALSEEEAAAVDGKIAWLSWDDSDISRACGSAVRFDNAAEAGAIGVLLTSELNLFYSGIAGNSDIPGFQLTGRGVAELRESATAGTLWLRYSDGLKSSAAIDEPSLLDTLNPSSSRGAHGSYGIAKPDVAAPGTQIVSAGVGTGSGPQGMSGTSMSSPHVAGIAADVVEAHPDWDTQQVKAAIVNTATHPVTDLDGNGYGPSRVGSGRVDALAATSTGLLAYATDDPRLVSVTFGLVRASQPTTVSREVTIENTTDTLAVVNAAYQPSLALPGVSYSVTPASVRVPAQGEATVTVNLEIIDPQALRKAIDPTMEPDINIGAIVARDFVPLAEGWLRLTPQEGTTNVPAAGLSVPVTAVVRPASTLSVPTIRYSEDDPLAALATFEGTSLATASSDGQYRALTVPLQLLTEQAEGGFGTNETARGAVLAAVGATSNVTRVTDPADAVLAVGVAWHGSNTLPTAWQNETDVYLDIDLDGSPDFAQYIHAPNELSDQAYVFTVDLTSGALVDVVPYAGVDESIDTNKFDSRVALFPVHLASLGLTAEQLADPQLAVGIEVVTFSAYSAQYNGMIDTAEGLTYHLTQPELSFGEAGSAGIVYAPQPGQSLAVQRGAQATEHTKALFLHLHNDAGSQYEVVTVAPALATSLTLEPTTAALGESVLYTVAGGEPLSEYQLSFADGATLGTATTDADGTVTDAFAVPADTELGARHVDLSLAGTVVASAALEVTAAAVVALDPVAVNTAEGEAPVLPAEVTASYSDGTRAAVQVTWDAIDPASYASIGMFQVSGAVAGTDIRAVATVWVLDSYAIDPTSAMTQEVYRFYKNDGTHFYTTSAYEADLVKGYAEYTFEGVSGLIAPADFVPVPGYEALHRFYKDNGTHFYTSSTYEAELVKTYPEYSYEGVVGFVPTVQFMGTDPVHRFYKHEIGTHFFTASSHEAGLVHTYPEYRYESISYYIKPAS